MSHIDPSITRTLGLNGHNYNPINFETEFHKFNREASRRRVYALIAWGVPFGAAVVAIVCRVML